MLNIQRQNPGFPRPSQPRKGYDQPQGGGTPFPMGPQSGMSGTQQSNPANLLSMVSSANTGPSMGMGQYNPATMGSSHPGSNWTPPQGASDPSKSGFMGPGMGGSTSPSTGASGTVAPPQIGAFGGIAAATGNQNYGQTYNPLKGTWSGTAMNSSANPGSNPTPGGPGTATQPNMPPVQNQNDFGANLPSTQTGPTQGGFGSNLPSNPTGPEVPGSGGSFAVERNPDGTIMADWVGYEPPDTNPIQGGGNMQPYGQSGYTGPQQNPSQQTGYNSPNPYGLPQAQYGGGSGSGSGGYNGQNGIGGVSAVNPQAGKVDYDSLSQFIDPAYEQAMTRLNPQMEQQSDSFDQQMINRGIPVGSEQYNEAKQQLDFNQNDAKSNAAFQAQQYGMNAQNQMFGQDATRSGLANSLLQSKWGNDFNYANLGENSRQYNDQSNYMWDRAESSDMFRLGDNNYRNNVFNTNQDWNYYNAGQNMLNFIPGMNNGNANMGAAAAGAMNSQNNAYNAQNQNSQNNWNQIASLIGAAASYWGN